MKKSLFFVLGVCMLTLAGCVNTGDVVSKSEKAVDKIKSGQTTFVLKNKQGSIDNQTVDTGTFIMKPFKVQIDQTTQDQQSSPYYIVDGTMYLKMGKAWYKHPVKDSDQTVKNTKNEMTASSVISAVKSLKDDLKAKKDGSNYVLSYTGSSKKAKQVAEQVLMDQIGAKSKSALKEVSVKKLTVKYTVDNKNYLPKKSLIDIKYKNKRSNANASTRAEGTYSSLNKINDVEVPNSVKKDAKKIPDSVASFLF